MNLFVMQKNLIHSAISVVIDSGPRYEVAFPSGVSHFLEKLAFNVSVLMLSFIFFKDRVRVFRLF